MHECPGMVASSNQICYAGVERWSKGGLTWNDRFLIQLNTMNSYIHFIKFLLTRRNI